MPTTGEKGSSCANPWRIWYGQIYGKGDQGVNQGDLSRIKLRVKNIGSRRENHNTINTIWR